MFRTFLAAQSNERWLNFWEDCRDLSSCPPTQVADRCNVIYGRYIQTLADEELSLDRTVRDLIVGRIGDPKMDMFQPALREAVAEMKRNMYPRFLQSKEYHELAQ